MDFINQIASQATNNENRDPNQQNQQQGQGGGDLKAGLLGKFNEIAGGGAKGEADEDALDKAVDLVQERILHAGAQNNESAAEQFKDEQISDMIMNQYKGITGSDFPIADK